VAVSPWRPEPDLDRSLLLAAVVVVVVVRTAASLETQETCSPGSHAVRRRSARSAATGTGYSPSTSAVTAGSSSQPTTTHGRRVGRRHAAAHRPAVQVGMWTGDLALAPDSRTLAVDDGSRLAVRDLRRRALIRWLGPVLGTGGSGCLRSGSPRVVRRQTVSCRGLLRRRPACVRRRDRSRRPNHGVGVPGRSGGRRGVGPRGSLGGPGCARRRSGRGEGRACGARAGAGQRGRRLSGREAPRREH
jgi:hypothetical protein